jgi:hypothetical protein
MIYIIDNFLGDYQFQVLYNSFNSQHFPWHYAGKFATYQPNRSRLYNFIRRDPRLLYHNFYDSISTPQVWVSPNHEWLHTFFPLCNTPTLLQIRANLILPCGFDMRHSFYHTDVSPEEVNNYTAIFYLHGNSTPTIFKTGLLTRKLVFPKANRIVLFPAYVQHAHYLPVKESRMVINFNFSSLPLDAKMYGDVMNMGGHLK